MLQETLLVRVIAGVIVLPTGLFATGIWLPLITAAAIVLILPPIVFLFGRRVNSMITMAQELKTRMEDFEKDAMSHK